MPLVILFSFVVNINAFNLAAFGSTQDQKAIAFSQYDRGVFRCGNAYRIVFVRTFIKNSDYCKLGGLDRDAKILLIGNSHADSIKEVVTSAAISNRFQVFLSQENMMLNSSNIDLYLKVIDSLNPRVVVLHTRVGTYDFKSLEILTSYCKFRGIKILVIQSTPEFADSVPFELLKAKRAVLPMENYTIKALAAEDVYFIKQEKYSNLNYVRTDDLFCDNDKLQCRILDVISKRPYYFDSNHLTLSGAKLIEERLRNAFSLVS